MVRDWYETNNEEHPGASKRNLLRVVLDGAKPLQLGQYRILINSVLIKGA